MLLLSASQWVGGGLDGSNRDYSMSRYYGRLDWKFIRVVVLRDFSNWFMRWCGQMEPGWFIVSGAGVAEGDFGGGGGGERMLALRDVGGTVMRVILLSLLVHDDVGRTFIETSRYIDLSFCTMLCKRLLNECTWGRMMTFVFVPTFLSVPITFHLILVNNVTPITHISDYQTILSSKIWHRKKLFIMFEIILKNIRLLIHNAL